MCANTVNRRKLYKTWIETGSKPPRQTLYSRKRKINKKNYESSSDDMEEFYDMMIRKKRSNNGSRNNIFRSENNFTRTQTHETPAASMLEEYNMSDDDMCENYADDNGSSLNGQTSNTESDDEEYYSLDEYEEVTPMNIRLSASVDHQSLFSQNVIFCDFDEEHYDNSDDEEAFWASVEEGNFTELENKLSDGEVDAIPEARLRVSQAEMLYAVDELTIG